MHSEIARFLPTWTVSQTDEGVDGDGETCFAVAVIQLERFSNYLERDS